MKESAVGRRGYYGINAKSHKFTFYIGNMKILSVILCRIPQMCVCVCGVCLADDK